MKYRLLKDGEIVKAGDEFLTEDCVTWEKIEGPGNAYDPGVFSPIRRIIPAEPEVLNPTEYVKSIRSGRDFMLTKGQAFDLANKMHQNGRLERDKELRPFFNAFSKYYKTEGGYILKDIVEVFKNLPPLTKND